MTSAPVGIPAERLVEMMRLLRESDDVELKMTVPETSRRSAIAALDLDPLEAQIRQVWYLDTPDLDLDKAGVVARVRRVQGRGDDSVVKLRPVVPTEMPASLRDLPEFVVELDAMPGGYVCSGSLKGSPKRATVKDAVAGREPLRHLFTKEQRQFYADHAPEGLAIDDLHLLGPINVLKLKFEPEDLHRRIVVELWAYPDGSRILELSTKCATTEPFDVAAETRAFLESKGIEVSAADQQAKTRTALDFFSGEMRGG
jgi:hypothetical protein